ncbi:MAG TPA: HhH-GPD-type base excision DNA repair protein [Acidimicrobiales bacterium]|nr:HhH-GPD-type base excision DNA repair protein [Acidimicrobiales bacterium]
MTRLHLSADPRADRLISKDPLALLIGMVLDQQVTIEQAFRGPAELADRLGLASPLDAGLLASMDPAAFAEAFSRRPSIHRYPASMAARVQALCRVVADEYGGDAARIWKRVRDGLELRRRLEALPGFGAQKARIFVALCGKQLGVRPPGWEEASAPYGEPGSFRSVADIVDAESLAEVRLRKREAKAAANPAPAGPGTRAARPAR